jgi:hypothetical protein
MRIIVGEKMALHDIPFRLAETIMRRLTIENPAWVDNKKMPDQLLAGGSLILSVKYHDFR